MVRGGVIIAITLLSYGPRRCYFFFITLLRYYGGIIIFFVIMLLRYRPWLWTAVHSLHLLY